MKFQTHQNQLSTPIMDPSSEVAVQAAPAAVVTVTESSQESKVENTANGIVTSSVNSEKTFSQSVQDVGDQTVVQKR